MSISAVPEPPGQTTVPASQRGDPARSTQRGRLWLAFSFIACPCHLPVSMAVLATVFGGTAFGSLIGRNTIAVGVFFGIIYAIGVGIGFRHLRAAAQGLDCSTGSCEVPPTSVPTTSR